METTLRHDNKQQEAQPRGQEDSRGGGDPSYGCRAWELREGRGSLLPAQGQVCHSTRKQYILTPTGFTNEDFFFFNVSHNWTSRVTGLATCSISGSVVSPRIWVSLFSAWRSTLASSSGWRCSGLLAGGPQQLGLLAFFYALWGEWE